MNAQKHILVAISGSVACIKINSLITELIKFAEVKIIATQAALTFINIADIPKEVKLFTDENESSNWKKIGDLILHIELRRWADMILIAPLSANTLSKISNGLADNLLTNVIRAWDFDKPLLVAPAMNTHMWNHPITKQQIDILESWHIKIIWPITKTLACGDTGIGAMAETVTILSQCLIYLNKNENKMVLSDDHMDNTSQKI